jgi:hypothetical protein
MDDRSEIILSLTLEEALEAYSEWQPTGKIWSRLLMSNLPIILIIHLQGAGYRQHGAFKDCQRIEFPRTINMNKFLDGQEASQE